MISTTPCLFLLSLLLPTIFSVRIILIVSPPPLPSYLSHKSLRKEIARESNRLVLVIREIQEHIREREREKEGRPGAVGREN